MGPNLTLAGIGMVFGMGFTATSGKLNMPFNIVFSPSKDNDWIESGPTFSILVGFNIAYRIINIFERKLNEKITLYINFLLIGQTSIYASFPIVESNPITQIESVR